MIIRRYLLRETMTTFFGVILVILAVAISNKFVRLVGKTATGDIAPDVLWQLFLFQIPELLAFLLPIALFLAILLCFGRFFADNEIPVMFACGINWQRLASVTLILGMTVMVLCAMITCYWGPNIAHHRERLLNREGPLLIIQSLSPGRFHAFSHDRFVFYMAHQSPDKHLKKIFIAEQPKIEGSKEWSLLTAQEGQIITEPKSQNTYIKLKQGRRYNGMPGDNDYTIIQFNEYERLIEEVSVPDGVFFHKTLPTKDLWDKPTPKNIAELQWRLSIPIAALLLAFLALPLSKVNPRGGRYKGMFFAIIICIGYFNLLTVSKRAVGMGTLSPTIGLWWVHILLFVSTLFLLSIACGRWDQFMHYAKTRIKRA